MRPGIESGYIHELDKPSDQEIARQSFLAEKLTIGIIANLPGFDARLSTDMEDSGKKQIQKDQQLDGVAYIEGRPVLGLQVTTAQDPKTRQRKMQEMMDRPFLRLPEMGPKDTAIPRALIYVDREIAKAYGDNPELRNQPEVVISVLDGIIKSLQFDLLKTKNPQEQKAIMDLSEQLNREKKKLIQ